MSQAWILPTTATALLHMAAAPADVWLASLGGHAWKTAATVGSINGAESSYLSDAAWHRKSPLPDIMKAHNDPSGHQRLPVIHQDVPASGGLSAELSPRASSRISGSTKNLAKNLTPLTPRGSLVTATASPHQPSSAHPNGLQAHTANGSSRGAATIRRSLPPRTLPPIARPDEGADDVEDGCRPRNPTPERDSDSSDNEAAEAAVSDYRDPAKSLIAASSITPR